MYRHRTAFIGPPSPAADAAGGAERWLLYRHRFDLPARPDRARLRIGADGRYQLFVNGARIGRGPSPADPLHLRLDLFDLGSHLRRGDNAIAVLVRSYGSDTAWYERAPESWRELLGEGGLCLDGEVVCGDGSFAIGNDARWRCLVCDAWEQGTPRAGPGLAAVEVHDARRFPQDWAEVEFDDSGWDTAKVQVSGSTPPGDSGAAVAVEPFPTLLEREIALPLEEDVHAEALLRADGVTPEAELPLERRIFEEQLLPLYMSDDPRTLRHDAESPAHVQTRPDMDASLLVDFGRIHPGYPFFVVEALGGEVIDVAVSESRSGEWERVPAAASRITRAAARGAHVLRYVARPGVQRFEAFEWSPVRYMQVVVRNAVGGLKLQEIGSRRTRYPAGPRGSFRCSDPALDRLWRLGQYTLQCCMVDGWIDGPAAERRARPGDAVVELLAAQAAFGPAVNPLTRQLLLYFAETQRSDGLTRSASGGPGGDASPSPEQTLQWILAAEAHLRYTADEPTLEAIFPAIQRALGWFEQQLGAGELLADVPYRQLHDWAAVGIHGESALLNALLVGALRAAERVAGVLEQPRVAARYAALAARLAAALNARHWDPRRGAYVDVVDPESGRQDPRISQQANAALIAYEVAPRERWAAMVARISDPKRLVFTAAPPVVPVGEELDLEEGVVLANARSAHVVLRAYARADRTDLVLEALRALWSPMLDGGATALWESFEPGGAACHGGSTTPVFQLSTELLGVSPLSDGFTRIRIAPQPLDLTFAEGVFPTVLGDVRVAWTRERPGLRLHVEIPLQAVGRLVPPKGFGAPPGGASLHPGKHDLLLPRE